MKLSVVIPVYKGAPCLTLLNERLEAVLRNCTEAFEVIFVNDGSPDNSWDVIRQLAEKCPWVRGINLMRNFGQHNALLAGIHVAQYELIVTMDDDLQHPPEEIPKLLEELGEKYDVVYGVPETQSHSLFRSLTSRVAKGLMAMALDMPVVARSGAFRAFRTQIRQAFLDYRSQFVSIDVLLGWGTTRFGFVTVRHDARHAGTSNYTVRKLVRHMFNMVMGFGTFPLRLASILGFVFTFFGLSVLAYVVIRYLVQGSPVQGFPFLASIIATFSGAQLFALGIFGEYLARIYFRLLGRPPSVTRETVGWVEERSHG